MWNFNWNHWWKTSWQRKLFHQRGKISFVNMDEFKIPHFYIIWKILKNPPVGTPIVAEYNCILTPASIFVGHFLKEFYCKFDSTLTDSTSLIRILEKKKSIWIVFLFAIDFKSLLLGRFKISFWLPKHHSKCTFNHWLFGISFKKQSHEFWSRILSTNFCHHNVNQRGTNFSQHLNGYVGKRTTP